MAKLSPIHIAVVCFISGAIFLLHVHQRGIIVDEQANVLSLRKDMVYKDGDRFYQPEEWREALVKSHSDIDNSVPTVTARPLKNVEHPVLLWAYARGGSSLAGEMFNKNENFFYWYEPEMLVNVFLFGQDSLIRQRHFVIHKDLRTDALRNALRKFLACDTHDFPPDFFSNEHLYMMDKVFQQRTCAELSISISAKCRPIMESLRNTNPNAFVTNAIFRMAGGSADGWFPPSFAPDGFQVEWSSFIHCINASSLSKCKTLVSTLCESSPWRAAKSIYIRADQLKSILSHLPQLKVLHYVRDPRAITVSRCHIGWESECPTATEVIRLASQICRQMRTDIEQADALERARPGTIYRFTYESLVAEPAQAVDAVYAFLGAPYDAALVDRMFGTDNQTLDLPPETETPWNTYRREPHRTATKWRQAYAPGVLAKINSLPDCAHVLRLLNYTI